MAYGSILPASLQTVEVWLTRMFVGATLPPPLSVAQARLRRASSYSLS